MQHVDRSVADEPADSASVIAASPHRDGRDAAGLGRGVRDGAGDAHRAPSLEALLLEWQATAEPRHLEALVAAARTLAEDVAGAALARCGIHDLSAVDEAVCLVLDHLRRLPGDDSLGRHVARFAPRTTDGGRCAAADPGRGYLVRLSHDRALDVARSHQIGRAHV